MAGPFARIIASVVMAGVGAFSKAFLMAYQQAAANAARGGGAAAAKQAAKSAMGKKLMERPQALAVLNYNDGKEPKDRDQLEERYTEYFEANDPKNGGSFYLQSKIHRAWEVLEPDFRVEVKDPPGPDDAAGGGGGGGDSTKV